MATLMVIPTKKRKVETFVKTGNRNYSALKPVQSERAFVVSLMRLLVRTVITMRRMKHEQGLPIAEIQNRFPDLQITFICDIVWYRVLRSIEIDQSDALRISDMFELSADTLREFAVGIGLRGSGTEMKNLDEIRNDYTRLPEDGE